ncbi:MAG: DNA/RNA non-specific endonuclease [Flavobacteriales bacterium]|nr:DNA/RNA non-specific endonuclease [Flavobacteriales bacterium]MBK6943838.1 DNA/RNA non-specific endonuclease [Flavobacteriales bacterium]MBK7240047.1 DNA/RNA non-specific endonuclease [Flavobacteriales bacterium]MBK9535630.1 DNA/RNA non-specific endonuclease [Flavobacteriales bacterium]MBP9138666.1 DNA/RNA non-specific endonuclease [Flavobacteriales bacterium]
MKPITYILLLLAAFLVLPTTAQTDLEVQLKKLEEQNSAFTLQQEKMVARLDSVKLAIIRRDLQKWGLPKLEEGDELIVHPGHMLVYSEKHEQPKWTVHIAAPDLIKGNLARIDSFLPDPLVKTGTAVTADYWYSGYDRGHMVPSADMRWTYDALLGTYYYSNISPQLADFNRGKWAELEDWGRRYVYHTKRRVFIATGPVLRDGLPTMQKADRKNEVSIPELFWKVIVDLDGKDPKAIAFVMKNEKLEYPVISYAVPVDSVEKLTGIDFFPSLEDELENRIEVMADYKAWYEKDEDKAGETAPIPAPLPNGMFNSVQAKYHVGKTVTVCGTVVASRTTVKAKAIYLNFDTPNPDQEFYATVWQDKSVNFSYDPETYLLNKKICVTGKVTMFDEVPRISINNESEVQLYDEAVGK